MDGRQIGSFKVSEVGLGCMNLSHAYGTSPNEKDSIRMLNEALDMGYTMLDTAALYGFGSNEQLLNKAVMHRRDEFMLASKCGMFKNDAGIRTIDGRPDVLKKTCEESLSRLGCDVIDLYYLHRWDRNVPIEDSVGALSDLVSEGKIRSIGLSEVSADTLRKAHAVHPISALQTEYSLWTRNPEISVLDTCDELGVSFVAFSPLGRGFLTGKLVDVYGLEEKDIRRNMPRFEPENYRQNLSLLEGLKLMAENHKCSLAQLSLAWLLNKSKNIIPIPGTTKLENAAENLKSVNVKLDAETIEKMGSFVNQNTVIGARYNKSTQAEIDTEEFSRSHLKLKTGNC